MDVRQHVPLKKESASVITQKLINDTMKLLGANKTIFSLGDSTHEGGDVKIYRDGSNNLALSFDADAASDEKALDIYGQVIFQNGLTIGKTSLKSAYHTLHVEGHIYTTGKFYCDSYNASDNAALQEFRINISGTDSNNHLIGFKIDEDFILSIEATGDGAGGIEDLKAIVNAQMVYNPSSDAAITAAGGITVNKAIMRVAGDGGAIDITANPQIVAGTDGQVVIIQGTHDTNTVTLDDGNGLALSAQCILAAQDNITLMYDSGDSEWIETSRTTVT